MSDLPTRLAELKPSRRTFLVAAAWTAPAVLALSAAPAYAASGDPTTEPETPCVAGTEAVLATHWWDFAQGSLNGSGAVGWTDDPVGFTSAQGPATDGTALFAYYMFAVTPGSRYKVETLIRPSWTEADSGVQVASAWLLNLAEAPLVGDGYQRLGDFISSPGGGTPTDHVTSDTIWASSTTVTVRYVFAFDASNAPSYGSFWVQQPTLTCRTYA